MATVCSTHAQVNVGMPADTLPDGGPPQPKHNAPCRCAQTWAHLRLLLKERNELAGVGVGVGSAPVPAREWEEGEGEGGAVL